MTTMNRNPSAAQLEALKLALGTKGLYGNTNKAPGRVDSSCCNSKTLEIMKQQGWIEPGQFIRDAGQREALAAEMRALIQHARDFLRIKPDPDWRTSLKDLKRVADIDADLARMSYWITDAGRLAALQTGAVEEVGR